MTSKRPSWRTTAKFRRSRVRIINGNSTVYKYKIKSKKLYVDKLLNFHRLFALLNAETFKVVRLDSSSGITLFTHGGLIRFTKTIKF